MTSSVFWQLRSLYPSKFPDVSRRGVLCRAQLINILCLETGFRISSFLPSALAFGRSCISCTDLKVLVLVERLRTHTHKVLCTLNLFWWKLFTAVVLAVAVRLLICCPRRMRFVSYCSTASFSLPWNSTVIRVQTAYTPKNKELSTHLLQLTPNVTAYFAAHINFWAVRVSGNGSTDRLPSRVPAVMSHFSLA